MTGAGYASTDVDPATFVVPGNASPAVDGAPVYDSQASALAGAAPVATLAASTKVRIDEEEIQPASGGNTLFRIHTDDGTDGWMLAASLVPRDSAAPRLWEVNDGTGAFSPNGDGVQEKLALSLRLSEPAAWALRVVNGNGVEKAAASGTSDTAAITWAPAAGTVNDGTFTWELEATDSWGNGPLQAHGAITVDTQAPELLVAGSDADPARTFTPNGDGSADSISFGVASSEPGTVVATATNESGSPVATISAGIGGSSTSVTWDGRKTSGAYAPDGGYDVSFVARDRAGNTSAAQHRSVDVFGAMGFTASSKSAFYPQDGDRLGRKTVLSFRLLRVATVTWTIVDKAGNVVRTLKTDESLGAGTYSFTWNGRSDAGAFVPRGTYRSVVEATNGSQAATQSASVVADAFRISVSDSTPARHQKITITATSSEALSNRPKLAVYQPGIGVWRVAMSRVSSRVFRVTVTLRSSHTGTVRLRVYARDTYRSKQASNLYLALH